MTAISCTTSKPALLKGARTFLVVTPKSAFRKRKPKLLGKRGDDLLHQIADEVSIGDLGGTSQSLTTGALPHQLAVGLLPDHVSRYNSPSRAESIRRVVAPFATGKGKLAIVLLLDDPEHLAAALAAVGRAIPFFTAKTGKRGERTVQVMFLGPDGSVLTPTELALDVLEASRRAAELVDTPPSELHPEALANRAQQMLSGLAGVKVKEIVGDELLKRGLRGIHAVGRAATSAPRMVIATYHPKGATTHVGLVGKGVTFDTGGLHLKARGAMETMKCDMGGVAAMLGAFQVLVKSGSRHRITLLLCIAENAIGPSAYKPDDILTMHSGKTVEINNTDAEGRLLLADGVSYAARDLSCDVIFDAATLTGAQLIATGVLHAAVVSNDAALEALTVAAGRRVGDLAHPLPFAPEFYKAEFKSPIADMTNSVVNRANAQTGCAAQFVYWHIEDTHVRWCHIDLAGPAFVSHRGTGYGVALVAAAVTDLA